MKEADCVALLRWALPRLGLRWEGFRRVRGQVCKRIGRRLAELGLGDLAAYRRVLESTPDEWHVLDGLCRVTISRFWRDRAVFERLGEILEQRAAKGGLVHVWSAGCASGEEAYSVALAFGRRGSLARLRVVATDADPALIERARRGCYPAGSFRELPVELRELGFEPRGGELCARPEIRQPIELRCEDIRVRMPPGPFAAILCRNLVFTYFEPGVQRELLEKLLERLEEGGVLVVGAHETVPGLGVARESPGLPIYRSAQPGGG